VTYESASDLLGKKIRQWVSEKQCCGAGITMSCNIFLAGAGIVSELNMPKVRGSGQDLASFFRPGARAAFKFYTENSLEQNS
jgi:hypothetical protein